MSIIRTCGTIPVMTALQMATASFAVPKSVIKTMVGRVFGFLAVSRWVPKPRQPVNKNVNSSARNAIPSRLVRERMLLPRCLPRMHHGAIGRPTPNTVLAHRMHLTPKWFDEIAPAGNLRDYNPGIEIQAMRWKGNGRDAVANSNSGVRKVRRPAVKRDGWTTS